LTVMGAERQGGIGVDFRTSTFQPFRPVRFCCSSVDSRVRRADDVDKRDVALCLSSGDFAQVNQSLTSVHAVDNRKND
jgi:hypothetical protein